MWLQVLFFLVTCTLLGIIVYYSFKDVEIVESQDEALCDALVSSGKLAFPKKDLKHYFQLRDEVAPQDASFEEFRLRLRASNPELVSEMKKALLRAAMAVQDSYARISAEYVGNMQLYKKLLLSERQWLYIESSMEELKETIEYIRDEASLIQDSWGDYIFLDARKLNAIRKKQEELRIQKEKLAREKELEEKRAREKEITESNIADKIAQELLEQEKSEANENKNAATIKKRK
ncbi:putative signal peptide-containing secreted protein [Cryptosporidium canis]|uniref:Signal peptide-containing secreted protein n=1 Tax=Cryptosporidium canis TaxID=195482 RepID=A0ABQ8P2Z7_9CRYT|nr:putative signal peptide-containing secreted protein [Cryptosporidium canis]KAJ1608980.1 putative signal peptide-containing secreted protein [Cryptosporidium canis]